MAADGGALRRLFEKPLPENPTLLEALSACDQVYHHHHHQHKKLVDPASFTEIFGELHFQEKPERAFLPPLPSRPPVRTVSWIDVAEAADKSKDDSSLDALLRPKATAAAATVKRSSSFCFRSSESLLLCTEGLGSESTVDADDMVKDGDNEAAAAGDEEVMDVKGNVAAGVDATEAAGREKRSPPSFPPPIRSIGRGGKPCVCFRSFRAEGRFVLMEVVIPGKELLQATREGGRLRMQFANAAAAVGSVEEDIEADDVGDGEAKNACAAIEDAILLAS